ncbi:MAG: GtrA family protein [Succinivibrio sp.]|nr:GtrA family protein [Succinivibrio sp.]
MTVSTESAAPGRVDSALEIRRFFFFCVVGACGFLTELVIIWAVKQLVPGMLFYARLVSFPPALGVTYVLNRRFVFKSSSSIPKEATLYTVGQIIGALLNLALYMFCLKVSPFFNAWPELALAAGSALGLIWNYLFSKFRVFTSPTNR